MCHATDRTVEPIHVICGRITVAIALRTGEEFWQAKFAHEIRVYRMFIEHPPPVRVPTLMHTDGTGYWCGHIPGHPVDAERYPEQPLPEAMLGTVAAFARWAPPPGMLAPVLDQLYRGLR